MSDAYSGAVLLEARIPGRPRGQGSMQLSRDPRSGREFAEYSAPTVEHRNLAVGVLRAAWGEREPHEGLVVVRAAFVYRRPSTHYGTGRNAGVLKAWAAAETWASGGNDTDKLCRLTGDALQIAGVLADDRQIVVWRAARVWGVTEESVVTVMEAT